jgi:hypothetical protein
MANEPDGAKLDAKIKELKKRGESLKASVDETHKAAEATKSAAAASEKELASLQK